MKNYTGLWVWLLAVALGVFIVNSASAKTQYLQAQINNKWVYLDANDFEYQVSGEFEGEYPIALFQQASRKQMLTWYKAMQNQTSPTQLDTFEEAFSFNFYQALFFNPEIDDLHFNGPTFSIDAFEDEIRSRLDEVAVGYSYALNLSKQYARGDGVGAARLNQDGYVSQSVTKRMNIASISKTLTAVAILQLLEKNGLSIHDPIEPWLPDDWVKGYGFFQGQGKLQPEVVLSFYDLLTHRSGIQQSIADFSEINQEYKDAVSNKWDGLKTIVEFGVLPAYYQDQLYKNANFALFRIMIPKLWKASGDPAIAIGEINETTAALYYRAYLDSYVLSPSGVHYADCADHSANPTLYYDGAKTWVNGAEGGDWILSCGSGGWYLSAYELAALMAHIRYNDEILSPSMRQLMDSNELGWSYSKSVNGEHGKYLAHGGTLFFDDEEADQAREMHGCVMKFPIQVEASLLINSSINGKQPCSILKNAFDAAWVD